MISSITSLTIALPTSFQKNTNINQGPLHTQAKGCNLVIVKALNSHAKVVPMTQTAGICVLPTSKN
jgi:hypothetical protein